MELLWNLFPLLNTCPFIFDTMPTVAQIFHPHTTPQTMLDTFSGATRVIYIVGDPIAQVKSPAGVTAMLRERGADAIVVPAHVAPADLAAWVTSTMLMRNVDGIIVTVPHKFAALALCRRTTPQAASIGAVNVMRRDASGGWFGDMCDGAGYVAGLRKAGCEPKGRRALLVGAGGAGSAIAHALVDAGVVSLALHEADTTRRGDLIRKLVAYGPLQPTIGSSDASGFDLVINATPMGMKPGDPLPVQVDTLAPGTFVGDVVTVPAVPPLMAAARARGCATMTGTGMFEAVRDRIVDFYFEKAAT
jgi:shikimate dehydrogenase